MKTHRIERTWEHEDELGTVTASAEVRFTYSVTWGEPANPALDDPGGGNEVSILKVEVEAYDGGTHWREATAEERERFTEWAESDLEEDMLEEALSAELADAESAAELRADERRMERAFGDD